MTSKLTRHIGVGSTLLTVLLAVALLPDPSNRMIALGTSTSDPA